MTQLDLFTPDPTWPENDCQAAFSICAAMPDAIETERAGKRSLEIPRKIAAPGELSDGTRVFIVTHCERWRYLIVQLGWETIAEIDQRSYFERPQDMALAVLKAIETAAADRKAA